MAAIIAVFPTLSGQWLGDDFHLVTEASCAHGIKNIPDIVGQNAGRCNYRAFRYISYAIDYSVWGLNPLGYHLTNLFIHLGAIALVYLSLLKLGLRRGFAAFGAALFALHPVQVDAVGYISGRRDVLMGLGYLWAFYGAICLSEAQNEQNSHKKRIFWAVMICLGAVVSVTSKEMGVTIVATIALFFMLGGQPGLSGAPTAAKGLIERLWGKRWILLALALPSVFMIWWRGFLHPISTMVGQLFGGSLSLHIATILAVHGRYAELLLFPMRLAGDYSPPAIAIPDSVFTLPSVFGVVVLGTICALAIYLYRARFIRASFGLGWYIITMLPVSHLIPHHELAAEHYLYIPLVGLALCAADLMQALWDRHDAPKNDQNDAQRSAQLEARRRIVVAALVLAVIALGARSFTRSFDYQSEITHAEATIRWVPESVRGRARLGLALLKEDDFEAARTHLGYVLGTKFQGSARQDVLRGLGLYFVRQENYQQSLRPLEEYLSLKPGAVDASEALSKAYFELGEIKKAHKINEQLTERSPKSADFRYKLALTAWMLKDFDQARTEISTALELDPTNLDALLFAANLVASDDRPRARALLSRAEKLLEKKSADEQAARAALLRTLHQKLDDTDETPTD